MEISTSQGPHNRYVGGTLKMTGAIFDRSDRVTAPMRSSRHGLPISAATWTIGITHYSRQ